MSTPALRLYGHPVSNFFNIARSALLEKGADFEVAPARAARDEGFLARSPMGKIPFLETSDGFIAETVAILGYLDDTLATPSLTPADPFARARVRQAINIVQMYLEAPLRALFPGVFFGEVNAPETVAKVRPMLARAMAALARLARLEPFLLGGTLTQADLFAFYCLDIGERVTRFVYDESLIGEIDGLERWRAGMAERDSSRIVLAAFAPAFAAYLAEKNAAYRELAPAALSGKRSHA
jgi:glutathione S-transferase